MDRPQVERLRHGHIIVIIRINLAHLFYRTTTCRSIRVGFIVYHISFTSSAFDDVAWFRKHDQVIIFDGIDKQLTYQPNIETRNRKRLRPNSNGRMGITHR